jgi:hypothetical protein
LSRVYGIPQRVDTDSWFPYQGPGLLEQNTQVSRLIESFDVPASVEGLRKAAQEMGDSLYLCRPNVKCRDEANKRLKEIGAKEEAKPNLTTPLSTSAAGPIEQSKATSVEVVQKPKKKWWQFWK